MDERVKETIIKALKDAGEIVENCNVISYEITVTGKAITISINYVAVKP